MMNFGKKRPAMGSGYDAEMKRQRQAYGYEGKMGYGFSSGMSSLNGQKSSSYGSALYGTSLDYGQKSLMGSDGGYGGNMSSSSGLYGGKTGVYSSLGKKPTAFSSSGNFNGSPSFGSKSGDFAYNSGFGFTGSASAFPGSAYGTPNNLQDDEDFTQDVDYTDVEQTTNVASFGAGMSSNRNMGARVSSRFYNMTQMSGDDEPFDDGYSGGYFQQGWGTPDMGNQGRGRGLRGRVAGSREIQFMEGRGPNRGRGSQQMSSNFQESNMGRGASRQMQQGGFPSRGRGRASQQMQFGFQGSNRFEGQQQMGMGAQQQNRGFGRQQQSRGFADGGSKMDRGVDPSKMSLSARIGRLSNILRKTQRVNAIQAVRDAVTSSRLNLSCDFEVEEFDMRVNGRSIFTGCVKISGVFISRSAALSKKELKHDAFIAAYEVLTKNSVADIMSQKDIAMEAMQIELMSCIQQGKSHEETLERLKDLKNISNFVNPSKGFDTLKKYLLKECGGSSLPSNPVGCLEQALSASKCKLMRRFDCDVRKSADSSRSGAIYRGIFYIHNIPIAVGKAVGKKEAKRECYTTAISNICKKSLLELMKGISIQIKADENASSSGIVTEVAKSIDQKFTELIKMVQTTQHKDQYTTNLDKILAHIGMTAKCIYRLSSEELSISCNLCIEDIVIASGESSKKRESQLEAYKNAWEFLETASAAEILKQNEKLESKTQNSSGNLKGLTKTSESNLAMLQKQNVDYTESWRVPEAMVILENTESPDRVNAAFHILNYSAVRNGMLLEWKWENESDKFRCTITLQNQEVGEALGSSKKTSRNIASAKALFKLYATCDVLRTHSHRDQDPSRWIRYEEKKKQAEAMKASGRKIDLKIEVDESEGDTDTPEQKADPFLLDIYKDLVNKFAMEETLDALVFDPATPKPVTRELQSYAQKIGELRFERRFYEGFPYMVLMRQCTPQKMVAILKKGGSTGEYPRVSLVPKSQLPDELELDELIKKSEENQVPSPPPKTESQPRGGGKAGRSRGRGRGGRGRGAGSETLWKAREVFEQMV